MVQEEIILRELIRMAFKKGNYFKNKDWDCDIGAK